MTKINNISRTGPIVACGMAVYHPGKDENFDAVFKRADQIMYKNKSKIKSTKLISDFRKMSEITNPIPVERKRLLDAFFGALCTVSDGTYVLLTTRGFVLFDKDGKPEYFGGIIIVANDKA